VFPVGPEDDVLDLCCGNGLFTAYLARRCRCVMAIDISPDLLTGPERTGLANVTTQCADMRAVDFADRSFSSSQRTRHEFDVRIRGFYETP